MIKLTNVEFSYDKKKNVIDNLSLEIKKGDKICFFGESGCGKTTLIYLIMGLLKATKGKIEMDKILKTSVVFQENRLFPFMSVLKNITFLGADENTALENLKALGIEEYKNEDISVLSGGIERRVAIARALSQDFDYLVLDEPFTGLDSENIEKAAKRILEVAGDKPIILITHSKEEAALLNTKIVNL